ncbi:MAG: hypothetical protein K2N75_05980 [Helicobacter sp.]|uniref:hypothetical protein n=1 Tax=Helicobacter sp. TaxID=218 RepID=UPI0023C84138|nr:hypothetical protein [Helicobacter sp.]MDE5925114.1 hypothetical protein [Helicobacter sp.]MDE7175574.1 hypothetical protein [Helicobacter sp.]
MKKLVLGTLLSLGISSILFAEVDFIALATNGEFNEQSAGVKVLNDEEMSQVVGGAYLYEIENGRTTVPEVVIHQYGTANNSGTRVSYTAYYDFKPDTSEQNPDRYQEQTAYGLLNVDDGSGRYKPVVSATLNLLTNQVSVSIIGMNQYNPVYTRSADRYYADKILTDNKTSLMNTINGVIRNHAQTYLKNH